MTNRILTLLSGRDIERFTRSGFWGEDTIYRVVLQHARRNTERVAIRERERTATYGELIMAADRLAADLHAAGVGAGDRVAVWLPSRIETAVALLACSRNGYACCPSLHRDHTVGEVADLLERMRAAAFIVQPGWGADAQRHDIVERAARVASLKRVYKLAPTDARAGLFAGLGDSRPPPSDDDPNTLVYLAFTSGTTGEPKGVMHSDNTLLAGARAMSRDWSFDAASVIYSLSPLSHNLGFVGALVMTLYVGGELVLHDLPRGSSLADRIIETGATFVIGVPTHAIDLLAEMRERGLSRLGHVRGFRISGAAVAPIVAAGLMERGVVPQAGFGMTEAGSHNYSLPGDTVEVVTETSGRTCAAYELKVFSVDNPDEEIGRNEVGQLGGRGAMLMLGYFGNQAATETSFNAHGYFMTGDLGTIDDDGCLRVTGRKKDVIIRGGHNIFPARIENLALRHPRIDKAAAIPVRDPRLGEKVCLAISLKGEAPIDPNEVLAHLDTAGLSRFDMPEFMLVLPSLPLTPAGKILKRDLVEMVTSGTATPEPVRFVAGEPR